MSELKVNSIKGTGASTAAITLNSSDGTCTANITNRTNKNIFINGAMNIAQRGTSSTADGYTSVDRIRIDDGGQDDAITREQANVTSGGAYNAGFRKCLKITNGNQTGGAGATDYLQINSNLEAQDIACSGWNYTSTSSYVTLSFWIKSSVAQAYSGSFRTVDGTSQSYKFDTPSLTADTWTKVTKTIPGNSNLTFDNNNNTGLQLYLYPFLGTTYTSANSDTETWVTSANNTYANNMTTTWWTTNGATFEITGIQLEVGSVATDFEHRPFGQELARCQRYFQQIGASGQDGTYTVAAGYLYSHGTYMATGYVMPVMMRATPTVTSGSTGLQCKSDGTTSEISSYNFIDTEFPSTYISISAQLSSDAGNENELCIWANPSNGSATLSAEL